MRRWNLVFIGLRVALTRWNNQFHLADHSERKIRISNNHLTRMKTDNQKAEKTIHLPVVSIVECYFQGICYAAKSCRIRIGYRQIAPNRLSILPVKLCNLRKNICVQAYWLIIINQRFNFILCYFHNIFHLFSKFSLIELLVHGNCAAYGCFVMDMDGCFRVWRHGALHLNSAYVC